MPHRRDRVWLFDLDDTLHDAGGAAMPGINAAMGEYVQHELALSKDDADALRRHYWRRYGATLLGLVRHHGVDPAHFLHQTHLLPGLEGRLRRHPHDVAALARLRGRKFILTNAPRVYAERVLAELGLRRHFNGVVCIEDMRMFGQLRPKPDLRMFRRLSARLKVHPSRCVLVEDTLAHQKSARQLGMTTVWMQRWAKHGAAHGAAHGASGQKVGVYLHRKPAYVCARIVSLQQLMRLP